jgi:hypothetical protein
VTPASVTVHIERLVLDGDVGTPRDGERVAAAVRAGLERLFDVDTTTTGGPGDGAARPRPGDDPMVLGDAIARAVHHRISDQGSPSTSRCGGER